MSCIPTGTLVPPGKDGVWKGKVTKPDGTRPTFSLGTSDKALARRRLTTLAADVAAGRSPDLQALGASESVAAYAAAWLDKRKAQGIAKAVAGHEEGDWRNHCAAAIGRLPLAGVTPSHIRGILDEAVAKGLKRGTVEQIRGVMHRLFGDAWRAELVDANPVARVRMPTMRETRKARAILTDEECAAFIGCDAVDVELRVMAAVARCEGGMRSGDLNQWSWEMLDRVAFAECFIPRSKTSTPQRLAIPAVLVPFLRGWWERQGKPAAGPVFPVRIGKRAGSFKARRRTYSARLRKGLAIAGVFRLPPTPVEREVRNGRGTNTRTVLEMVAHPADPLHNETSTSLPVDWHSFRRAFSTGLASANVNAQTAMVLASHADAKTHARYVAATASMRMVPDAALPRLSVGALTGGGRGIPRAPEAGVSSEGGSEGPRLVGGVDPESARIVAVRDDSIPAAPASATFPNDYGAGEGIRTLDVHLGKVALYH